MGKVKIEHPQAGTATVDAGAFERVWKGKGWKLAKGAAPAAEAAKADDGKAGA